MFISLSSLCQTSFIKPSTSAAYVQSRFLMGGNCHRPFKLCTLVIMGVLFSSSIASKYSHQVNLVQSDKNIVCLNILISKNHAFSVKLQTKNEVCKKHFRHTKLGLECIHYSSLGYTATILDCWYTNISGKPCSSNENI